MVRKLHMGAPDFAEAVEAFFAIDRDGGSDVSGAVAAIIKDVRQRGFQAVAEMTARFDGHAVTEETVRVPAERLQQARRECDPEIVEALEFAAARIRAYHDKQLPENVSYTDEAGVELGWRWTPVAAAGLYAPGGRAAYPSSVLMNAIPAKAAGVERLAMTTPVPNGEWNDAVLAAAAIAGVDEIYAIGGAQAIAALTFGAGPIAPVDVVVGPGNAYVAEAKRQVFGHVGIDNIAGPSEILVVADRDNNPDWIAADLLSQAEHDPSSQSILITDDETFASDVETAVERQLSTSPREEVASAAWRRHSAIIVVDDLEAAPSLIDRVAPEHLELAVPSPRAFADKVRNAGAIFLGAHTPEAVGDYVAGPDHVLPTGGGARFASGLSVFDFLKRTSLMACDAVSLARIGPAAARLADAEGLPSHAQSVRLRLPDREK